MTLKRWLKEQGFPHGMECIGEIRLQQLWDTAQDNEREKCAKIVDSIGYSHTAGLSQYISSEFARAAQKIRDKK